MDFLLAVKAKLDLECSAISLSRFYQPVAVHQTTKAISDRQGAGEESGMATYSSFSSAFREIGRGSMQSKRRDRKCTRECNPSEEQVPADKVSLVTFENSEAWLVKCAETVTITARTRQLVRGKLVGNKHERRPSLVCVEPAQIPIQGVWAARGLAFVTEKNHGNQLIDGKVLASHVDGARHELKTPHGNDVTTETHGHSTQIVLGETVVMLANFSDENIELPKATIIGIAEEVSEPLIVSANEEKQIALENHTKSVEGKLKFQKYASEKLAHLSHAERKCIEPVLVKYAHVFHDEQSNEFRSSNVVEHRIETGNAPPIRKAQYRVPFALRDEMKSQVQNMLDKGVIRDSTSPWQAPAILVPKKSSDGKPKYRFCVDFRALNNVTKFDTYPLPLFEQTTSTLAGSKYFSVLDCYSGFWQINIREQDKEKTAFTVPSGHYEFNRLCYGLSNSPATFQRAVDVVLKNLTGTECWVFIDDVIIFSRTVEEHALRLANVLQRFEGANLQLQPEKCVFAQSEVQYLGHVISREGIRASPDKVKAVKEYPIPKTVKEVRSFLGLASYYRRLVPKFAEIAKPLTELTRKEQTFEWDDRRQSAFEELKSRLCTTPVLAYPDFQLPFILTTDGSKTAVAAILSQVQEGVERPISFASRQLNKAESSYSASEVEMLALVWATKYFRCYLYGKKFLVRTDHAALSFLHKFADNNSRLMRWSLRLAEFEFVVEHTPGTKISHVDALSRHVGTVNDSPGLAKREVLAEQLNDPFCEAQKRLRSFTSKSEFFLDKDGVMYKRQGGRDHQLVVPQSLVHRVIAMNHEPQFAAHPGRKRTFELISLRYWWPKMRQTVEDFVTRCDACMRRKSSFEFRAPLGDVEEPTEPFQVTAMDITGPYLLTPRKNKYLLTFIDHYTRYAEAYPIPDQTAETCARVYATQIITRHGCGSTLITDQGRAFVSAFFKEVCKILKVRKVQTSAYHPSSNGIVERFHKTLHDGLSHYIDSSGTNWDNVVPFFLMAHRGTPSCSTGYSPYYLLHGREMKIPTEDDLTAKLSPEAQNADFAHRLEDLKSNLRKAFEIVRQNNKKSHQTNKSRYDKRAKERTFEMGDIVYLFSPAKKTGQCQKFRKFWAGPYKITGRLSELNYKIVDMKGKELVVHVNRLKKAFNQDIWRPKTGTDKGRKMRTRAEEEEDEEIIQSRPMVDNEVTEPQVANDMVEAEVSEPQVEPDLGQQTPQRPEPLTTPVPARTQPRESVDSTRQDPSYVPPDSPRTRRELQTTPHGPPLTRSRARMQPRAADGQE
jgi:transposase InsO family protein